MMELQSTAITFPIEGDLKHSQGGESFARIVDRLRALEGVSRQVLVTSPGAQEGKTVTAVNLALAFHSRDIPVLLAELSLEKPRFGEILGPSPLFKGMEDVVARDVPLESTICVRTDNGLNVAMVNKAQKTNQSLQANTRLDRLLKQARDTYEWTIFDGPSIESTPAIHDIAARIGIVLLVVRARRTSEKALQDAIVRIGHPKTFVLLNDE